VIDDAAQALGKSDRRARAVYIDAETRE